MNVSIEHLSTVKKKLSFTFPADRVEIEINKAYDEIQKHASLKGFRKGKVPRAIVEKKFYPQMCEDVLNSLVGESYIGALRSHNIIPLSQPFIECDDLVRGESLSYAATVEVVPEITVKDFEGIPLNRPKFVLNEDLIDSHITSMRESVAKLTTVDVKRPAEKGDSIIIDFQGFVADTPIENGSAEDYVLELGSNSLVPGFEEQLLGVVEGEKRTISVTFPENYHAQHLNGKEVVFNVQVKQLKIKELPQLDDDFAKDFGAETVDELRAGIAKLQESQEAKRIKSELKNQLIEKLVARNDIEAPEILVQRRVSAMYDNMRSDLAQRGLTMDQVGLDDDTFNTKAREAAELQVKGELLLNAIAKIEGISVDDEDIVRQIDEIAESTNRNAAALRAYYQQQENKDNFLAHVKEEKVIDLLLEKAVITDTEQE